MNADNGNAAREPRTHRAMNKRKRVLLAMSTTGLKVDNDKRARSAGVNLHVENGMQGSRNDPNWVFGPDPDLQRVPEHAPSVPPRHG